MTNLSKQVISAGAASVGDYTKMAVLLAEQQIALRDTEMKIANAQGTVTQKEADSQQAALEKEGDMRLVSAAQSFTEAGATGLSEAGGHVLEGVIGNKSGAKRSQMNLTRAEQFEQKFNGGNRSEKNGSLVMQQGAAKPNGALPNEMEMQEIKPKTASKKPTETPAAEMESREFSLYEDGDVKDLNNMSPEDVALIDHLAKTPDSPRARQVRKQINRAVKLYRTQTEATTSTQSRRSQQAKEIIRGLGTAARGGWDVQNKNNYTEEAKQKVLETQAKFAADTYSGMFRSDGDMASSLQSQQQELRRGLSQMSDQRV